MSEHSGDMTGLINRVAAGLPGRGDAESLYRELRSLVRGELRRQRQRSELQTTEVLHQVFLRLVLQAGEQEWPNRAYFFASASRAVRRVLVEEARRRLSQKRGGGWRQHPLEEITDPLQLDPGETIALDDALERLARVDPRAADVVTYRFFGGLSIEEVAELLGVSPRTVKRDWQAARAWLLVELEHHRGETR